MWEISKSFDFCYGHRVWNQTLNSNFSIDGCLKCRHLHGHQGHIIITLQSDFLTDGMVTDFKHLNWFKKLIDDFFDHKFIIDISDPAKLSLFPYLTSYQRHSCGNEVFDTPIITGAIRAQGEHMVEIYEGLVVVDFVPTSENLSTFLFKIVQSKMKEIGVIVKSVKFFETPKSSSEFINV